MKNQVVTAAALLKKINESTSGISFDTPTFIRVLEYARESIKSDNELHEFVESLNNIYSGKRLDMKSIEPLLIKD